MANILKMAVFADFHYRKFAYPGTLRDLDVILKRAADEQVDFVIHAGDFSNNYHESPELKKAWLDNKYDLPVYGIYGNHELEYLIHDCKVLYEDKHPMQLVTPMLTNRADEVHWGTPDGKPLADGSIAYYWFEQNGFRIVCTDTSYSYSEERDAWEHNPSLYVPKGNVHTESLGEEQRRWLEDVLTDAAHKGIPCIVFSHSAFADGWHPSHDKANVRAIFNRVNAIRKGTVVAAINGHLHTDNAEVVDNIVFLDINTVNNGYFLTPGFPHYDETHTFLYTEYDEEGNERETYEKPYKELFYGLMGNYCWFYREPLSCIITVSDDGTVTVDGAESSWAYGIEPPDVTKPGKHTYITSGTYKMER